MKAIFIGFFIALSVPFHLIGQELSKGTLRMEVEKIMLNGEEAPTDMGAHLGNISISLYADGVRQKTEFSMMMMNNTTYYDTRNDSIRLYMDLMGKKYLIADTRSSIAAKSSKSGMEGPKIEVKEDRNDVKEILGFQCYKVYVKVKADKEGKSLEVPEDIELKLYVTDKLKFDASYVTNGKTSIDLKGTPLEYNMRMGGSGFQMEMIMVAKEFKAEVDSAVFDYPTGNYKIYDMESFQMEMSKMGK